MLGGGHPDTAFGYATLASLQEDPSEAVGMLNRCLEIQESLLGEKHPAVADTCDQIGDALRRMGILERSLEFYERSLKIHQEKVDCHLPVARLYAKLGIVSLALGNGRDVVRHHARSIASLKDAPVKRDQAFLSIYDEAGKEMLRERDFDNAVALYRQALSIRKVMCGQLDPDIAIAHEGIGFALFSKGDYIGALREYQKSLSIRETTLEEDHADLLAVVEMVDIVRLKISKVESLPSHAGPGNGLNWTF
ncbi:Hydra magnipapillata [Seminavis robusta]|uniref:Hydra magnipapillata n=1 Tax=Seminavis robusta TaxID=568900 RepID=A0A9N8DXT8_9STRA|nr:Hydra magnipapillata [Seminavis robusta]|eukprot:Sro430_g141270.1 Hydra magnipapillata (250) ;mRNA; r:22073-22822